MPLLYLQQIEDRSPDLTGLFPLISPDPAWADLRATLDSALATGRPVFTIKPMPGVEALYAVEALPGDMLHVLSHQRLIPASSILTATICAG